jgi:carbonic anhydrase
VDAAVRANAKRVARQLVSESGVLRDAVETGKLKVVAARYDLDTGAVDLLE